MTTYDIAKPTGEAGRSCFLFGFDDIGSKGLWRWVELRNSHRRGIAGMIHSIGIKGMALETALSEAGAAFEHIGYRIALDRGQTRSGLAPAPTPRGTADNGGPRVGRRRVD